jgi:hypothetical protein
MNEPEKCFFVTEFMERGTLDECLKSERGNDFSLREYSWQRRGQKVALDVIEAVAWLHRERGPRKKFLSHNDLK